MPRRGRSKIYLEITEMVSIIHHLIQKCSYGILKIRKVFIYPSVYAHFDAFDRARKAYFYPKEHNLQRFSLIAMMPEK